jgi:xanthine/uracil permease
MYQPKHDRSLGGLFGDLVNELSTLIRQEFALARAELTQKATEVGKGVGYLAIGGALAYAGVLAILAALIVGLAVLGLPWWLAPLLVGLVVVVVGYFLIRRGLDALKASNLAPRKTIKSIKENREWAKDQMK